MFVQGFKGDQFDIPHNARRLGEGGSATIYQETLFGELRATKYPKKVSPSEHTATIYKKLHATHVLSEV